MVRALPGLVATKTILRNVMPTPVLRSRIVQCTDILSSRGRLHKAAADKM